MASRDIGRFGSTIGTASFNNSWDEALHAFCLEYEDDMDGGSVSSYSNAGGGRETECDQSLDRYNFASQKHLYKFGYQSEDEELECLGKCGRCGKLGCSGRLSSCSERNKSTAASTASSDQDDFDTDNPKPSKPQSQQNVDDSIDDLMRYLAENINDSDFSECDIPASEKEDRTTEPPTEVIYTDNTPENSTQSQSQKTTQELLRQACTQKYVARTATQVVAKRTQSKSRKVLRKKRHQTTEIRPKRSPTKREIVKIAASPKTISDSDAGSPPKRRASARLQKRDSVPHQKSSNFLKTPPPPQIPAARTESLISKGRDLTVPFEDLASKSPSRESDKSFVEAGNSSVVEILESPLPCVRSRGPENGKRLFRRESLQKRVVIESSSAEESSDSIVVRKIIKPFMKPSPKISHKKSEFSTSSTKPSRFSTPARTPRRSELNTETPSSECAGEHVGFDDSELCSQDLSMHVSDEEFLDDATQAVTCTQMQRYTVGAATQCPVDLFNNKRSVRGYDKDIDTSDEEALSNGDDQFDASFINDATLLEGTMNTEISPMAAMTQGPVKTRRQRYLRNMQPSLSPWPSPKPARKSSSKRKRIVKFADSSDEND